MVDFLSLSALLYILQLKANLKEGLFYSSPCQTANEVSSFGDEIYFIVIYFWIEDH